MRARLSQTEMAMRGWWRGPGGWSPATACPCREWQEETQSIDATDPARTGAWQGPASLCGSCGPGAEAWHSHKLAWRDRTGDGLKRAGLVATMGTALVVWRRNDRGLAEPSLRGLADLVGWRPAVAQRVIVEPATRADDAGWDRGGAQLSPWAWLVPVALESGIARGRCFVTKTVVGRETLAMVEVQAATGLLGAWVVVALRQRVGSPQRRGRWCPVPPARPPAGYFGKGKVWDDVQCRDLPRR